MSGRPSGPTAVETAVETTVETAVATAVATAVVTAVRTVQNKKLRSEGPGFGDKKSETQGPNFLSKDFLSKTQGVPVHKKKYRVPLLVLRCLGKHTYSERGG